MYADYIIHFGLECVGQAILWLSYTHVCKRPWHRFAIWLVGSVSTTIITVHLVG